MPGLSGFTATVRGRKPMWNFGHEGSGVHSTETKESVSFKGRKKMKSNLRFLSIVATACLLNFVLATPASATHFRYGQITWTQDGGNSVNATVQLAWRRASFISCVDPTHANVLTDPFGTAAVPCSGGDGFVSLGDVTAPFTSALDWGDASTQTQLYFLVTSVDLANNWFFGVALDLTSLPSVGPPTDSSLPHAYTAAGPNTASFSSCCRLSAPFVGPPAVPGLINNADGGFSLETVINAGGTNNSPVTALPPIKFCPVGGLCQFNVPGSDPDAGDTLGFRLSTSLEADRDAFTGFIQPTGASIHPMTGLYSWDSSGLGVEGDLFSTQVMIEDSGGPQTTKVAVDFLIELVTVDFNPPVITGPAPDFDPLCDTAVLATAGVLTSFDVLATDIDAENVTLNAAGLPAGAAMTPPLPAVGLMSVQSTFDWTPTTSDVGAHIVTFDATTPSNGQTLCPVTITVDDFVAAVEPDPEDPEGPVTVFAGANDPDNDNPFDMDYQQVNAPGTVTAGCCQIPAIYETKGHGHGIFGYFKPTFRDVGKLLRASDDPNCADLIPLIPKRKAYITPTQRVLADPALSDAEVAALYYGDAPEDFAARANLRWAFCVIESDVPNTGIAVLSENAAKVVGYEVDCEEDVLQDRGLTTAISIDPPERIKVFKTATWECDRSRSGRRSSR